LAVVTLNEVIEDFLTIPPSDSKVIIAPLELILVAPLELRCATFKARKVGS
jgi:hypothetical protein